MKDLCLITVANSESFHEEQIPCNRPVKYIVSYKKGTTGQMTEQKVCGLHFRQLEKISKKLKDKLNYNNEFTYVLAPKQNR